MSPGLLFFGALLLWHWQLRVILLDTDARKEDDVDPLGEEVCIRCAAVGVFRWLKTCREIGHDEKAKV